MSLHSMPSILLHLGVASSSSFLSSSSSSSTLLSSFTSLILLFLRGRISPQSHPDPRADAPRRSPRGARLPPDVDGCSSSAASSSARQTEAGRMEGLSEGREERGGKVKTDSRLLSRVYRSRRWRRLCAEEGGGEEEEEEDRRGKRGRSFFRCLPSSLHTHSTWSCRWRGGGREDVG